MEKFSYDLVITASNETEAETKMKALTVLASKLTAREFEKLAHVVKHEPIKLAMAKKALGV